jgi:glycosyltransferase involved in cell wall biosynthesis
VASHVAELARACGGRATIVDPARGKTRLLLEVRRARAVHVHVCGHNRGSFSLLGVCLAAARGPVIVTLHSGLAPVWLATLGPLARSGVRFLLGRCAAVVCVSSALADRVHTIGTRRAPVLVAPAFLGAPSPRTWRRKLPADGRPLVAAAVAPGIEYGADLLVAAFSRLQCRLALGVAQEAALRPLGERPRLIVFGPGSKAVAAQVDGAIGLGELAHDEALGVIARCDVFVRPTRADGDALSVREALALGRRVVASDAAARPPGVITYPTDDPAALAQAIDRALSTPASRVKVERGLDTLRTLYARLGVDVIQPEGGAERCAASPAE